MPSVPQTEDRISVLENARLVIELEERERQSAARAAANKLWRIVVLSPGLEVCEALSRGEKVPVARLDPAWARRFRLR